MNDQSTQTQTHLEWREKEKPPAHDAPASKRVVAGVCGILLGAFGVHKFILGYTAQGVILLLVTVLTLGFGGSVTGLIGIIEGIIYLAKSDADFVRTYQTSRRNWF